VGNLPGPDHAVLVDLHFNGSVLSVASEVRSVEAAVVVVIDHWVADLSERVVRGRFLRRTQVLLRQDSIDLGVGRCCLQQVLDLARLLETRPHLLVDGAQGSGLLILLHVAARGVHGLLVEELLLQVVVVQSILFLEELLHVRALLTRLGLHLLQGVSLLLLRS